MLGEWDYELNGVRYRAAAIDEKYTLAGEPLRPPNSQIIQGQSNLFNLRPDLLRWRISDWAGGQGQYAFDGSFDQSNRYWKGFYVDGFTRYGVISPGWGGAYDSTPSRHLIVQALGSLWAVDQNASGTNYKWNESTKAWATTGATLINTTHAKDSVAGDDDYLYYFDGSSGKIYKDDTAGTVTEIGNSGPTSTAANRSRLIAMRNFLILGSLGTTDAKRGVWQLSKNVGSTTALTQIYDMTGSKDTGRGAWCFATGPNRVFFATKSDDGQATYIHEVIPDDASATGYGYIRATIPGVSVSTMWYSNGFIWIAGRINEAAEGANDDRGIQLMYLDLAQSTFGSISSVFRDADDEVTAVLEQIGGASTGSLSHVVSYAQMSANVESAFLFQIDQSTGGVQLIGEPTGNDGGVGLNTGDARGGTMVAHNNSIHLAEGDGSGNWGGLMRWGPDLVPDGGYFITPWYEYGLADEKSLSSVELSLRKGLPADWDVDVYYQADDDTGEDISGWTQIGSSWTTDGETNKKFSVSTATAQVTFNRIRFAVQFDYVGGGTPSSPPELTTFEATAQVATKFRVREIWLSLMDEQGQKGRKGHLQVDNIRTAGDLGTVINFKDGYQNRDPSDYEEVDVLVDAYRIILDRPGEGVAYVRLLESY